MPLKEIDSNRQAWSAISREHYLAFRQSLLQGRHQFNAIIQRELGDLQEKTVLHLQCNTGADTILLARQCAQATGVDLVPENIHYAEKLARDCGIDNVRFIESDILTLSKVHQEKYDVVFTSEGVLGWLPDLEPWAKTIREHLKEDGVLYLFDSHPIFLMFDEARLCEEEYSIKYPYFSSVPDEDDSIGGYACPAKRGVKAYFWMHPLSEIITSLAQAGLHIQFLHEFTENFFDSGGMPPSDKAGLYQYPYNTGKYPMSLSLRATVVPGL